MELQFSFHPEIIHLLPIITVAEASCECCDESAGWFVEFGWMAWSVTIIFLSGDGKAGHP